jgi:hypothetical protein
VTNGTVRVTGFLCDAVQSAEGKLHAIGVGWNEISTSAMPTRHDRIGVGILLHVPFLQTNQQHRFDVRLEDEDSAIVPLGDAPPGVDAPGVEDGKMLRLGGEFTVGRPPTIVDGDEQVIPLAVQLNNVLFELPGLYSVVIAVDSHDALRLPFRIRQV